MPLASKIKSIFRSKEIIISSILILSTITAFTIFPNVFTNTTQSTKDKPYFGISFNGATVAEAKNLIDKTKNYTNLFVLQSGPISKNETAINTICDYAVQADLDFIVFFGWFDFDHPWQIPWLDFAKQRWGEKFLGVYLYDEPGGIQIDYNWDLVFHRIKERFPEFYESISVYIQKDPNQLVARDYEEAKNRYIEYVQEHLQITQLTDRSITSYTSDYALYWFDYQAGYDTVFVELGWNHNTAKHIALCRGAANLQQKDWGTIIVWNDRHTAYNFTEHYDERNESLNTGIYKTGPEMLEDMYISYEAGADYIIIFNYPTDPPGNPYGILTEEHFEAIEQFWNYMQQNPNQHGTTKAKAALVLPEDYAWGMRRIEDKIWGYWGPDEKTQQIWDLTQQLLAKYGYNLDIVYEDSTFSIEEQYQELYYWNLSK